MSPFCAESVMNIALGLEATALKLKASIHAGDCATTLAWVHLEADRLGLECKDIIDAVRAQEAAEVAA